MALGSTFPADDVPSRRGHILEVLAAHDPVPVPTTALYLGIEDKRALADEFAAMEAAGEIEPHLLVPGAQGFEDAARMTGLGAAATLAPIAAYRLTEAGRGALR